VRVADCRRLSGMCEQYGRRLPGRRGERIKCREILQEAPSAPGGVEAARQAARPASGGSPPALVLGYAQMPEPTIRAGVRDLAEAVRAARRDRTPSRDGQL
jgi:DNA-binding transcriptional MocR family regulator